MFTQLNILTWWFSHTFGRVQTTGAFKFILKLRVHYISFSVSFFTLQHCIESGEGIHGPLCAWDLELLNGHSSSLWCVPSSVASANRHYRCRTWNGHVCGNLKVYWKDTCHFEWHMYYSQNKLCLISNVIPSLKICVTF